MIRAVIVEGRNPLGPVNTFALSSRRPARSRWSGEADDGRAGLRLCVERTPDAAFLDIRIPGPDGRSLAGRLQTLARPPSWSSSSRAFPLEVTRSTRFASRRGGLPAQADRVRGRPRIGPPARAASARGSGRRVLRRESSASDAVGDRLVVKDASREGDVQAPPPWRHRRGAAPGVPGAPGSTPRSWNARPRSRWRHSRAGSAGHQSCRSPATRSST